MRVPLRNDLARASARRKVATLNDPSRTSCASWSKWSGYLFRSCADLRPEPTQHGFSVPLRELFNGRLARAVRDVVHWAAKIAPFLNAGATTPFTCVIANDLSRWSPNSDGS
jgi:hypothetical protein